MKIVAPAGDMESFHAAIKAGAHEIYMGLRGVGARRNATNFTLDEFHEALDHAHLMGVKILLTLNTIMTEQEMEYLYTNIKSLYEQGLDSVIVQDLGYAYFLKENFPDLELHGSTQMSVGNHVEINYLKKLGFKRMVLPRELSFEEIKNIKNNTNMPLEVFVSGALCVCISGNCYMSSFIGGRSGNRGLCAQPCRKIYTDSDGNKSFFLSPKDQLYTKKEIKRLLELGIDSIKIEGRMKDPLYVYETVKYYSDMIANIDHEEKTSDIFNRGYSTGYFYKNTDNIINPYYSSNKGKNLGTLHGNELKLNSPIIPGDGILYLDKDHHDLGGKYINKIIIKKYNKTLASNTAGVDDTIILDHPPIGTRYVYRNYNKTVVDDITDLSKKVAKRVPISFNFTGHVSSTPILQARYHTCNDQDITVEISDNSIIENAKNSPTSTTDIHSKLSELGNTPFYLETFDCDIDSNIFMPGTILKKMKRDVIEALKDKIINSFRRTSPQKYTLPVYTDTNRNKTKPVLSAIVSSDDQYNAVKKYGIKKIYHHGYDIALENDLDKQDLTSNLASNLYQLLKDQNEKVTVNWNMNIINRYSIHVLSLIDKVDTVIISPEISFDMYEKIGSVPVKKAILIYSRLKAMHTVTKIFKKKNEKMTNEEGDSFIAQQNKMGETEIFFEKPLNIIPKIGDIADLDIDEYVLEFTTETASETMHILNEIDTKEGYYLYYNYKRGVY